METTELLAQIKSIQTADDLAAVLDHIRKELPYRVRFGISAKELRYFSSDTIAPKRFRTFKIRKKSGGTREIKAPCYQLKVILTCVNEMLKTVYHPSDAAMGFTQGRSVMDNAQMHVGHNYVFNIDLKDFFPSIPQARVWKRLQLPPFGFPQEVANVLAGLCCSHDEAAGRNVLPQGSPASPLLTNAICDKLDRRMKGVAKRFGLHYSRYADDMTFSSMHNVYKEESDFRKEIQRIITGQGFRMNEAKTRLQKKGTRQEVTGLIVNDVANVSRKKYMSDLRWILHLWETEGYAKAYAKFYPKYKSDKGYIKKGEPVMENVIGGKLDYLRMVRGASNAAYKKLKERFDNLQQIIYIGSEEERENARKFMYVQPYTVKDFQDFFHTEISLEVTPKGKLVGKCDMYGTRKTLSVSRETQKILCPRLASLQPGAVVETPLLEKCNVILCREKGKNYWLITIRDHRRDKILSIQNVDIDPDRLLDLWEQEGFDAAVKAFSDLLETGKPLPEPSTKTSKKSSNKKATSMKKVSKNNDGIPAGFVPKDDDLAVDLGLDFDWDTDDDLNPDDLNDIDPENLLDIDPEELEGLEDFDPKDLEGGEVIMTL